MRLVSRGVVEGPATFPMSWASCNAVASHAQGLLVSNPWFTVFKWLLESLVGPSAGIRRSVKILGPVRLTLGRPRARVPLRRLTFDFIPRFIQMDYKLSQPYQEG